MVYSSQDLYDDMRRIAMKESEKARELNLDQAEQVSGGAYVP